MPMYAQVKDNVRVDRGEVPEVVVREVERLNADLVGRGRILVRPSGTEPLIRVLAEMETAQEAEALCGSIADLVRREARAG
jgi:phosphoglucosamine mutase